ncbi:MAG: sigma-70 family RNA polymerase sigma factor [Asticcacaulis sp.]
MTDLSDDRALWLSRHVLPHEPALRQWLGQWRLCDIEVDDVVQETYAILASRETVGDIRNPRAYCFQTARSVILMQLRRAKVVSIQTVEDIDRLGSVAIDPSPEEQVSDRQQFHKLVEAMGELPDQGRQAVFLRLVEGLTQREIGHRLGISENAAQKHVVKSVHKLMNILGKGGKDVVHASKAESRKELVRYGNARKQSED